MVGSIRTPVQPSSPTVLPEAKGKAAAVELRKLQLHGMSQEACDLLDRIVYALKPFATFRAENPHYIHAIYGEIGSITDLDFTRALEAIKQFKLAAVLPEAHEGDAP